MSLPSWRIPGPLHCREAYRPNENLGHTGGQASLLCRSPWSRAQSIELWAEREWTRIQTTLRKRRDRAAYLRRRVVELALQEWTTWETENLHESRNAKGRRKVSQYYKAVHIPHTAAEMQQANWRDANPWSSAFIGWIMREAGATRTEFRFAWKHLTYIDAAKKGELSLISAYPPTAVRPQRGDIICNSRANNPVTWATIKPEGLSHADIVVDDSDPNEVTVIGGNVGDKVAKKYVALDGHGFLKKARARLEGGGETEEELRYFAVLRIEAEPQLSPKGDELLRALGTRLVF